MLGARPPPYYFRGPQILAQHTTLAKIAFLKNRLFRLDFGPLFGPLKCPKTSKTGPKWGPKPTPKTGPQNGGPKWTPKRGQKRVSKSTPIRKMAKNGHF